MVEVTSVQNMRVSDKNTIDGGVPSRELMYKASQGIYKSVKWQGKILIACGTGNNAGDGYALAHMLKKDGFSVELLLTSNRFSPDGEYYFSMCKEEKVPTSVYNSEKLQGYDIIVDCIFGTGFKGCAQGKERELIEAINQSGAYVVSADINSGLNGDSGMAEVCVKSNLTLSIGTYKSGHFLNMAKDKIEKTENIDIGIELLEKPYLLLEKGDVKKFLGKRPHFSHKGTYGYVTLIGGSLEYSGAIKLSNLSASAMRAGAGVVKLAIPKSLTGGIMPYLLESTLYPLSDRDGSVEFWENEIQGAINGAKAVAIGMGLGQRGDNEKILTYLLKNCTVPLIIDADGLNTLAKMDISLIKESKATVVLTPHLKELERLCGVPMADILDNPIKHARDFARKSGAIVLLKGTATIITDGEDVYLTSTGNPGMATAGSGDVLSGIVCALCASYKNTLLAVAAGAYINGYAGDIAKGEVGEIPLLASDTASAVGKAIKEITE